MTEPIDWVIVLIAGASLIFASFATIQVLRTSAVVRAFVDRADRFLNTFQAQAKGVFSPDFVADTITRALTKDIKNPDGSPVSMPQFINGYIQAYGPGLKAEFKAELPKLIPLLLQDPPQDGPPNPGTALANQRWHGSGGLNAAKALNKASKKVPFLGKITEYVEGAQALVSLVPVIKELKGEIAGLKGGGNGEDSVTEDAPQGSSDWGPPF